MQGYRLDSPDEIPSDVQAQLFSLENAVMNLLTLISKMGTIVIVTNAETGWVELSCQRFIPRVLPYVQKLKVLSARSTFEPYHPNAPSEWKHRAFEQEMRRLLPDARSRKNIISMGDSLHEREAVQKLTRNLSDVRTKSVKFVERPNLDQLKKQVDLVTSSFDYICNYEGDLDLMLTISLLV